MPDQPSPHRRRFRLAVLLALNVAALAVAVLLVLSDPSEQRMASAGKMVLAMAVIFAGSIFVDKVSAFIKKRINARRQPPPPPE